MVCSKCGSVFSDDAVFCSECGTPINATGPNQQEADQSNSNKRKASGEKISFTVSADTLLQCCKWYIRAIVFFLACSVLSFAFDFARFRDQSVGLMALSRLDRIQAYFNFILEENLVSLWTMVFFVCLIILLIGLVVLEKRCEKAMDILLKDALKQSPFSRVENVMYSSLSGVMLLVWIWVLI